MMHLPRVRFTCMRCLALLAGAMLGLISSLQEISRIPDTPSSNKIIRSLKQPRPAYRLLRLAEPRSNPKNNPYDGIIESPSGIAEKKKLIPTPVTLNISALGAVVNPHPFHYTIEPKDGCQNPFLAIYIHTAPDHYDRRDLIRRTWGNTTLYLPATRVRVFFMMGVVLTPELANNVQKEADQYQDIIQESFVDAYHNLSYKAVGAMKWITTRCKQAKFILKTDDDVFINTFTLIKHLKDLDREKVMNKGLLMCLVWYKMHVLREGKWSINKSVIADEYYPAYCSGMGYIMSPDVAEAIYKGSAYVPFFWVDDAYITGMVPKKLGLEHVNIVKVFFGRKEVEWLITGPDWHKYVFCHLRDLAFFEKMWMILQKRGLGEVIPDMKPVIAGKIGVNYGPKKPPEKSKDKAKSIAKNKAKAKAKTQERNPKLQKEKKTLS